MKRPWTATRVELEGKRVCKIPLSQGKFALIDEKYLVEAQCYGWREKPNHRTTYARTNRRLPTGERKNLFLHQLIWQLMGRTGPVDHKNNDGLDCREQNLRPGPKSLNGANRRGQASSGKYKGVSWKGTKWYARICVAGKDKYLGYFRDEIEAACAYDKEALAAWGPYARLNFPESRFSVAVPSDLA